MTLSSKLFKLKEWFSINETAKRLSSSLDEEIKLSDIFRLALDKHLILSLRITHNMIVQPIELKMCSLRELNPAFGIKDSLLSIPDEILDLKSEHVIPIGDLVNIETGFVDLPMLGAEVLDIERLHDKHRNVKTAEIYNVDGVFIKGNEEKLYRIMEPINRTYYPPAKSNLNKLPRYFGCNSKQEDYVPSDVIPKDVEIVVRRENIEKFEKLLEDSNDSFTIEDYQNILFSLKELVCSKAKKWSQDEINNELDNTLKGMSKRRLETMWSMLNKKYK